MVALRGGRRGRTEVGGRELAHLSDEAVLALIARGDDQALAELYRRFGRLAYGLALRILRDDALAQDAVQEAFLGVWRAADRFVAERAKPSTWLLTLVHRRAVDLVRREERRRAEPLPDFVLVRVLRLLRPRRKRRERDQKKHVASHRSFPPPSSDCAHSSPTLTTGPALRRESLRGGPSTASAAAALRSAASATAEDRAAGRESGCRS